MGKQEIRDIISLMQLMERRVFSGFRKIKDVVRPPTQDRMTLWEDKLNDIFDLPYETDEEKNTRDTKFHAQLILLDIELDHKPKEPHKIIRLMGQCHYGMGQFEKAVLHFERAIDLHPDPSNTEDFIPYAENYIQACTEYPDMPKETKERTIERLKDLAPLAPEYSHIIKMYTAALLLGMQRPVQALTFAQQSLTEYPNGEEDPNFGNYFEFYQRIEQQLSKNAIRLVKERKKDAALTELKRLKESVQIVSTALPANDWLRMELVYFSRWTLEAGQKRNLKPRRKNNLN